MYNVRITICGEKYLYNLDHMPQCLGIEYAKTRYLRDSIRTGTTNTDIFPWQFPGLSI